MKRIFFLLIGLFYSYSAVNADSLNFVIFQPETLPSDIEKIFFDRLKDGKPMLLPQPVQKLPENMKLHDVWHGNRPYMRPSVQNLKLAFTKESTEKETGGSFELDFEFATDGIILKHSNPAYANERGGLRIGRDKLSKPRKFYFRGKEGQSFTVSMPAYAPTEQNRGMLICPRDFLASGTRDERASLQPTNYKITEALGSVKSEMNAYLKNPINFVLAEAKLLTTPGVAPALINYDRSYSKDSAVSLLYKADEKAQVEKFKDYSNFSLGIENFLNLHFSTGYKRVSKGKALVYVKEVEVKETMEMGMLDKDVLGTELETELKLRGISFSNQGVIGAKILPGSCYLVLYRVLPIIHEYLEQEFVVPADFKE